MSITSNIKTEDLYTILSELKEDGWKVVFKYEGIDAGVDYDLQKLEKDGKQITFSWEPLMEGDISCTDELMEMLRKKFNI